MTLEKARKIFGFTGKESQEEIKKKYRELIQKAHPDNNDGNHEVVYILNAAYECILKCGDMRQGDQREKDKQDTTTKDSTYDTFDFGWNAPINESAYIPRTIYMDVEGIDGDTIGSARIGYGKYVWCADEEFTFFQKSIYEVSKELLTKIEEEQGINCSNEYRNKYLGELVYLLAGQYVSNISSLKEITGKKPTDNIYKLDATLELRYAKLYEKGISLYPERISEHRLYLKDGENNSVGYVSFQDNRLYFVVIPLFEAKNVQIKCSVKESNKVGRRINKFVRLDLWIKLLDSDKLQDDTNNKIDRLLKEYRDNVYYY